MAATLHVTMVAAAMLGLAAVLGGVGLLLGRPFASGDLATRDVLLAPWLGFCLLLAFLQAWHLVLPVTWHVLAATAGLGAAGLAAELPSLRAWWSPRRRPLLGAAAALGVGALWLAGQTVAQPTLYDSGLYHLNAIRWAGAYPVVPGLGNLHGRLAFNSSFFLYAAALNVGPLAGRCHHLATGSLFLLALAPCAYGLARCCASRVEARPEHVYAALFLAPVLAWLLGSSAELASSPTPDAVGFLLGVPLGGQLLGLLTTPTGDGHCPGAPRAAARATLAVLLLSLGGLTAKLSFLGLGAAAAALALHRFLATPAWRPERARLLAWSAAATVLFIVPWALRSIVMSGYVAYPCALGAVPVDWRVSEGQVAMEAGWVRSWARQPHVDYRVVLADWGWLRPWARRLACEHRFEVVAPLGLTLAGILAASAAARCPWPFLAAPATGLAFWFLTAPAPRYAGAAFWMLAFGALAPAVAALPPRRARAAVLALLAALLVPKLDARQVCLPRRYDAAPARTVPMREAVNDSGLRALVPTESDQCWDAPLPCTPYLYEDLRLRVPGDLSRGFTFAPAARGGTP